MDTIYDLIDKLLPFSWAGYTFMKNALLGVLIISPLFGMLGTMIVSNRMAFFSDALGHSALTGIALGTVLGLAGTDASMVIFAVIFALLLNRIRRRKTLSTDTVISVFASLSMAIGLVILSAGGKFSSYSSILVGDILSISAGEIGLLLMVLILTAVFWFACFNKLHATGISDTLARSKNIHCALIEDLFCVLMAVIVMFSIRWVGILIINALLILPAAASRNISANVREYSLFSVIISVFSGITGLILSYYLGTATGPSIVIIASAIFFMTLMLQAVRTKG
jgi:zinc transport system permease protein